MKDNSEYKILIGEDNPKSQKLLKTLLESHGYQCITADDGNQVIEKAMEDPPDLILLDIMMPGKDGYETCTELKSSEKTQHVPVIMVTALTDRDARLKGLGLGADDYLMKPYDSTELLVKTRNFLKIKTFHDYLENRSKILESEVQSRAEELEVALDALSESKEQLRRGYIDTVVRLTNVAEYRDENTALHIRRVGRFCQILASEMGWEQEKVEVIFHAAPMHDIGKVGIPAEILLKPGKLNKAEFELMKTHTTIGAQLLSGSSSKYLRMAQEIALSHHERWDGGGYPKGLKGDDIPESGRIMNIIDQYDSLRSVRPYKPAFSHEQSVDIIKGGEDEGARARHFEPRVLECFLDNQDTFETLFAQYEEEEYMHRDWAL